MTTYITIKVGEQTDNYCDNGNERTEPISLKEIRTQDRAAIHASLVAAVEGLKYQQPHVDTPFHTEDKIYAMNATLDQVLTIINSIIKE